MQAEGQRVIAGGGIAAGLLPPSATEILIWNSELA
jgi:hypothetical protein